jgi:hypothetical protein
VARLDLPLLDGAEQIAENKATLGNFMTNEAKNDAGTRRKWLKSKGLIEAENEPE